MTKKEKLLQFEENRAAMIVSKDFSYYRFRMPEGMKQRIEEKTLKRINLVSPNPIVKRFEEEFQG